MNQTDGLRKLVCEILNAQRLAVLATQSRQQPYCNLVAFTPSEDLRHLFFATPRSTHKYSNLMSNPHVSLLCDTRSLAAFDLYQSVAITALGDASEAGQATQAAYRSLHSERHPLLRSFLQTRDCIFIEIRVERYIIVEGVSDISILRMDQLAEGGRPAAGAGNDGG